ncbi:MAG TPA: FHA domain-containing protein [Dehalococcoidia bacterium]|nr:FHA domain-containing protein [Dehalococcoidia bacterium]
MGAALLVLTLRFGVIIVLYLIIVLVVLAIWRDMGRAAPRPRITGAHVAIIEGGASGMRPGDLLPLLPVTAIGRSPDSAIFLDDPSVAANHALLRFRQGRWWLEDLGSPSGTWLNRRPVETATPVDFGDTIVIGEVRLRLEQG